MISLPTFPSSEKWWAMVKALSGMWTRHFTLEVAVIVDTQLDQLPVLETSSEIYHPSSEKDHTKAANMPRLAQQIHVFYYRHTGQKIPIAGRINS